MTQNRRPTRRSLLTRCLAGIRQALDLRSWEKSGRNGPAPMRFQQRMLRDAAAATGARVLVETGTHFGDMAWALMGHFREIYTMEGEDALFEQAQKRFDAHPHVHCLGGDSPELLTSILRRISEPCVFWLNAHVGTHRMQIDRELDVIAAHRIKTHAILVASAEQLTGAAGLPSLEELERIRSHGFPTLQIKVEYGIVCLLPA